MEYKIKLIALVACGLLSQPGVGYAHRKEPLDETQFLTRNTIRVLGVDDRGKVNSSGTGFFFNFTNIRGLAAAASVPGIVTCRHVVNDKASTILEFATRDEKGQRNNDRYPVNVSTLDWILHPDASIDLAFLPIVPYINHYEQNNVKLDCEPIPDFLIASEDNLKLYGSITDVTIIGYPKGLVDDVNNLPLVRRGITATSPLVDYQGKPQFVIDAAMFPGSSGSPVYHYGTIINQSAIVIHQGPSVRLMGVVFAVPNVEEKGRIVPVPIPSDFILESRHQLYMNLGYVVKAAKILDFKKFFEVEEKVGEEEKEALEPVVKDEG